MSVAAANWTALGEALAGDLLRPGTAGYEAARRPEMARFAAIAPAAIARCASAADVSAAIGFARSGSMATAIRSGGHCFAGGSSTEGLLIDVGSMDGVELASDTVTVGPGTRLGTLYERLAEAGRAIAGGCGPTVGIAGLVLGGGLGILGRTYGLTSDSLLAATVALADGRVEECDERRNSDLFWALRGAGAGRFGVVTSLRLRTVPAPACTAFELVWDEAHAAELVGAWQQWAPDGPDELAASLLLNASSDPARPARVTVFGAMRGPRAAADAQLDALSERVGAPPGADWRAELPWLATKHALVARGPGEDDGEMYQRSEFFRHPLAADAVVALVHRFTAGRTPGVARELDFTPWGGAYNRVAADATAFAFRDERFLLKHAAIVPLGAPAAVRASARRWLSDSWTVVRPWGTGHVYPNFPVPELPDPGPAYWGDNHGRVAQVRGAYDPDGFLAAPG